MTSSPDDLKREEEMESLGGSLRNLLGQLEAFHAGGTTGGNKERSLLIKIAALAREAIALEHDVGDAIGYARRQYEVRSLLDGERKRAQEAEERCTELLAEADNCRSSAAGAKRGKAVAESRCEALTIALREIDGWREDRLGTRAPQKAA